MRNLVALAAVGAACGLLPGQAAAQTKVDLRTQEGAKKVNAEWRYQNVKIIEVDSTVKGPDGKPVKTYNIEPKAFGPEFDDSAWEQVDPATLKNPRSTGQVCFCWYRTKVTIPDDLAGKTIHFVTTVDDYGEVWVDGKLPRKEGQGGGAIVGGFNVPNRVELKDPAPGKTYQIAIFAINGPISAAPTNRIFLRDAYLEVKEK